MSNTPNLSYSRSLLRESEFRKKFKAYFAKYGDVSYDPTLGHTFEIYSEHNFFNATDEDDEFSIVKKDKKFNLYNLIKENFIQDLNVEHNAIRQQIIAEKIKANDFEYQQYLRVLYDEQNSIIAEIPKCNWLNDFPYLQEELVSIQSNFQKEYPLQNKITKMTSGPNKLKWTANIGTLCNHFENLRSSIKNTNSAPYIIATREEVSKFIFDNFTDPKGNDFTLETIKRSMSKVPKKDICPMPDQIPDKQERKNSSK